MGRTPFHLTISDNNSPAHHPQKPAIMRSIGSISLAARWVLSLPSSSIEFVLLLVSENRVDWVCGVQEGYRTTTIKKISSFHKRWLGWEIVFYDAGTTKDKLCSSQGYFWKGWLLEPEWETVAVLFSTSFFFFILPLSALNTTEGFENVQITLCWHACEVF